MLSVSWLHAFLSTPLPESFLELFDIARTARERPSDSVNAHLDELVRFDGSFRKLSARDLYTDMVASFRLMAEETFGHSLMHLYHPDDETTFDSDPSGDQRRWSIPGLGEDFPVSYGSPGKKIYSVEHPSPKNQLNFTSSADTALTPGNNEVANQSRIASGVGTVATPSTQPSTTRHCEKNRGSATKPRG